MACNCTTSKDERIAKLEAELTRLREGARKIVAGDESFGSVVELLFYAPLREAEASIRRLRSAAVEFLNEAPMEGDYALLILSLRGSQPTEEQRHAITSYGAARKRLASAITPADGVAKL